MPAGAKDGGGSIVDAQGPIKLHLKGVVMYMGYEL
jgi:hypothetical protein